MPKPSFICIGSQRCGTTRLHRILSKHPDIQMTTDGVGEFKKEIHYFDQLVLEKSFKWYEMHFSATKLSGEITPAYSVLSNNCVHLVANYLPRAKIIFIVRNPIDRIWSQIRMMKTSWRQLDSECIDFRSLVLLFDSPAVELRSNYLRTYLNWRYVYSTDNILILSFDELLIPDGLAKLFRFLEVSDDWTPSPEISKPVLSSPKLSFPEELRWLTALRWSDMLRDFSKLYEPASPWLDQMIVDKHNIPTSFLATLAEVRRDQIEVTKSKWDNLKKHQKSLELSLAARLNTEE